MSATPDAAVIAALATNSAALDAYMASFAAPDATDDAKPKAKRSDAATKRIKVPTHTVTTDDGYRVDLTQVYATKGSDDRAPVAFKTLGGFRIHVTVTGADGKSACRPFSLPTHVVDALLAAADSGDLLALMTDARNS